MLGLPGAGQVDMGHRDKISCADWDFGLALTLVSGTHRGFLLVLPSLLSLDFFPLVLALEETQE
jgi:hypothetical protein